MPRRSDVEKLPLEVRANLDRRLHERAFSGYRQLADELRAEGYEISEDSLQRHGAKLQQDIASVEFAALHAKLLGEVVPDPETMQDSMMRLIYVRLLGALTGETELQPRDLTLLRAAQNFTRQLVARARAAQTARPSAVSEPPILTDRHPVKGEGGPSAWMNLVDALAGEHLVRPAPDSVPTEEEAVEIRDGPADVAAMIQNDPPESLRPSVAPRLSPSIPAEEAVAPGLGSQAGPQVTPTPGPAADSREITPPRIPPLSAAPHTLVPDSAFPTASAPSPRIPANSGTPQAAARPEWRHPPDIPEHVPAASRRRPITSANHAASGG